MVQTRLLMAAQTPKSNRQVPETGLEDFDQQAATWNKKAIKELSYSIGC